MRRCEAAVCLGRSEDSRRNDEKTVERWARRARFHSWLEWFRIRTPFARVPVSFFTNFILAVRAEDNTFFLPITASLTVGVLWSARPRLRHREPLRPTRAGLLALS